MTDSNCSLCSKPFLPRHLVSARALRPSVSEYILARHPGAWSESAQICKPCLAAERLDYLMAQLEEERGDLSSVEEEIAQKASERQTLAEDIMSRFATEQTIGQRIADRVAAVGGSWPFVIGFFAVLLAWIGLNSLLLRHEAFDPYPYILLNLALSCLAAVQAPIIMMSQNRHAARDRMQADHDFRINLKAELEVSSLHEKMDHLLHSQWQRMVELQEMQLDILNELVADKR
jgi:uncharacterized membrane protein